MRWYVAIVALLCGTAEAGTQGTIRKGGVTPARVLLSCALTSDLTCAKAGPLTFTRSTVGALCAPSAASGDSGDDNTNLTEPAVNAACVASSLGTRVVGPIKNELCASETLNDSVGGCDWLPAASGATITLNDDDAPLSGVDTLADKVTDDDAVVAAEFIRQTIATTTQGKYRFSIWLRDSAAHTASLQVEADTTPTATTQTCDVSVATTWKRFACTLDAGALTFNNITVRLYPTDNDTATATDDVFAWGAQLTGPGTAQAAGKFTVPYCRSTGGAATTCNGEAMSVASSGVVDQGKGHIAADLTPIWSPTTESITAFLVNGPTGDGSGDALYYQALGLKSNDGTTTITHTLAAWTAYTTRRLGVRWGGGRRVQDRTSVTETTGAFDGAFNFGATTFFGSNNASSLGSWAYVKDLKTWSKPTSNP